MKPWTILLVVLPTGIASAEVVHLNDGTVLEGRVRHAPNGYVVTLRDGRTKVIPPGDVQSIELKKASPTRAVVRGNDPATQPTRQPADTKASLSAIVPFVSAEKTVAASAALDKALGRAPNDPGLLYLKGLVLFQQMQLVPARDTLRKVETRLPEHAPTHNNLAVILWQTHALIPALAEYDKAMLAAPANKVILDNVAEALHALPKNVEKNPIVKRVRQRFQEQDAQLQERMRTQGLRRIGAKWVSKEEYEKRLAGDKAATEIKETYPSDVLALQARLMEIDRKIDEETSILHSMRQQSTWVVAGGIVEYPLPQRYYELEADVSKLKAERIMKTRQLEQLPKSLREALQRPVINDYTGRQTLIGVPGTPGLPPTTQPTTQPS